MSERLHSYPSIYALGHSAVAELLNGPVVVEEKVDGSQLNWGVFDGELVIRSKRAPVYPGNAGMFEQGICTLQAKMALFHPGWQYRGEYLQKPKHNALAYDRVPAGHIIIFDVQPGLEEYLSPTEKAAEAARLGLECVPCLYTGD